MSNLPMSNKLDRLALILLAAMPVIAVFSTRSSPLLLTLFALLAGAARLFDGQGAALGRRMRGALLSPVAVLLALGLALIWLSTTWAPDQAFARQYALQLTGNSVLIFTALSVAPALQPRLATGALLSGLAVAAVLILIELMTNGAIMSVIGEPPEGPFRLNRVVVTVVVLTPIAIAWCRLVGWGWLWPLLVLLVLATAIISSSGASVLGIAAALVVLPLALRFPVVAMRTVGVGAVLVALGMPWLAPRANDMIPESVHEMMDEASSQVRGEIWRLYAEIGNERPLLGFGLEASRFTVKSSAERGLTPEQVELLTYGHPHNAPLQVWFELGLVGLVIYAALLACLVLRMDRVPLPLKPFAASTFAAVFAVACISHGAWQGWWISLIGFLMIWWSSLERCHFTAAAARADLQDLTAAP